MGFLHNKGTGRFNARIITRNGRVTAHEMACVAHAAERFGAGLTLRDGTVCRPALLELLPDGRVRVTLHEGKYHQVKRMIAACGATVTFLKRVQLGGVRLDESLAPGEFRELTEEELGALRPPDGL